MYKLCLLCTIIATSVSNFNVIILRFGLSHDIDNYLSLVPSLCRYLQSC